MEELAPNSPELQMLINNKEDGFKYRERRHEEWDETYLYYRSKVITNRLVQRQSVTIPLMKQQVSTLMKDIDDMPVLYFENLDNDDQAQLYKNEYWNYVVMDNNMEIQDIVDKKQVLLFGRSFDQWQIIDGKVKQTIIDVMDILVSRYTDPSDINSSRYLIHNHIFVPISVLEKNPDYDQQEIKELKTWYGTTMGIIKVSTNQKMMVDKNQKMQDMGLENVDNPILGETYVELSLHFVFRKEEKDEEEQIYLYVEAENRNILMKKKLEDVIDPNRNCKDHFWRNHYPYESWASDTERQDFWSDGAGDIVRPTNKILNAWASQLVENRTLRNLGMQFYDSTVEGFNPGTFNPIAWGWYPYPGDPNKGIRKVDVPDLSESIDEMKFFIEISEKATGATSGQQGAPAQRQITLGEFNATLIEAKERVKGMSKMYIPCWKRRGMLFVKLVEANGGRIDSVKIEKKGRNSSKLYTKEISSADWETPNGYNCKVWTKDEKTAQDTNALTKLDLAKSIMPMNKKLDEVYKRKVLSFADLTPQETNDIMEEERQLMENPPIMAGAVEAGQVSGAPSMTGAVPKPKPNQIQA